MPTQSSAEKNIPKESESLVGEVCRIMTKNILSIKGAMNHFMENFGSEAAVIENGYLSAIDKLHVEIEALYRTALAVHQDSNQVTLSDSEKTAWELRLGRFILLQGSMSTLLSKASNKVLHAESSDARCDMPPKNSAKVLHAETSNARCDMPPQNPELKDAAKVFQSAMLDFTKIKNKIDAESKKLDSNFNALYNKWVGQVNYFDNEAKKHLGYKYKNDKGSYQAAMYIKSVSNCVHFAGLMLEDLHAQRSFYQGEMRAQEQVLVDTRKNNHSLLENKKTFEKKLNKLKVDKERLKSVINHQTSHVKGIKTKDLTLEQANELLKKEKEFIDSATANNLSLQCIQTSEFFLLKQAVKSMSAAYKRAGKWMLQSEFTESSFKGEKVTFKLYFNNIKETRVHYESVLKLLTLLSGSRQKAKQDQRALAKIKLQFEQAQVALEERVSNTKQLQVLRKENSELKNEVKKLARRVRKYTRSFEVGFKFCKNTLDNDDSMRKLSNNSATLAQRPKRNDDSQVSKDQLAGQEGIQKPASK